MVIGDERIDAHTILWAAGVAAAPIGRGLGPGLDRAGRVNVDPDLTVPGHPGVFVAGDLANFSHQTGKPLPGVAQVAKQQGTHAASNIARLVRGEATRPFRHLDPGNMATIGRANALGPCLIVRQLGAGGMGVVWRAEDTRLQDKVALKTVKGAERQIRCYSLAVSRAPRIAVQIGSAVGPYRILHHLGSGGMGSVWLAEDTRLHRQVALKTLRAADDDDAPARARLMREARAAAALNHPNIATVYDVLEDDGQVVIVFEYVEGETLAARLARGPLAAPEAVEFGGQMAGALVVAHAHGIVHRDLKPANVIVTAGGQLKVLDFGIARLLATGTTQTAAGLTGSGLGLIGTPAYAAPEQVISSAVDERADLYALGVMLFEMVSGRRPFMGNDPVTLASSKLGEDAPALKSIGALIPWEFERLVASLLARDRDQRPASATEVLEHLRSIYGTRATGSADAARPSRSTASLLAAVVLLAAVAGFGVWQVQRMAGVRSPAAPLPAIPVVAVLPLSHVSGDSAREFLAAGIAESLIASLASLPAITVLSRASVAEARSRHSESAALARDLGANYLVEGSVQESGSRLRISLNLVRPDRTVAWGDTIEGTFDRIFELQSRLAGALTSALAVRVSPDEQSRMDTPPTSSSEALSAFWRGQALLERRDVKGNLDGAIAAFLDAIRHDRQFALAHAALGTVYWAQYTETLAPEWTEKAIEAGTTALRIDPNRPEVRYTLAVTLTGRGRLDEAVDELNRALAMRPNYDDARSQLGLVLGLQGRVDESVAEYRKALSSRPNSWSTYSSMGRVLLAAGRYDDAIAAFQKVTELQPDNYMGFQQLGTAYHTVGKAEQALENYRRTIAIRPSAGAYSNIGALHHARGEYVEAVEAYRQAIALRPNSSATHRNLGDALARLGRRTEALAAYRAAVRLGVAELRVNPRNARILASLAVHMQKAGDAAGARKRLQEALEIAPTDIEVLYRAAVVHALQGRIQPAVRALGLAVAGGYSRARVNEEDDFVSLRASAEFQAIVGSLNP